MLAGQVFKAARALAPSVVLVEDADHVFLTDRARAELVTPAGGEPPNRIKKALVAEVMEGVGGARLRLPAEPNQSWVWCKEPRLL